MIGHFNMWLFTALVYFSLYATGRNINTLEGWVEGWDMDVIRVLALEANISDETFHIMDG